MERQPVKKHPTDLHNFLRGIKSDTGEMVRTLKRMDRTLKNMDNWFRNTLGSPWNT